MVLLTALIGHPALSTFILFGVRTTSALMVGVLCVRIAGRTTFSQLNALDIVVAIATGSILGRAMTDASPFLPTISAALFLVFLRRLLSAATARWRWLSILTQGEAVVVIRDGRADAGLLRKHRISEDDLMEAIRLGGAADLSEVRLAVLEDGGRISVIRYSGDGHGALR